MNSEEILVRRYVENKLYKIPELASYIGEASILWTENDPGLVLDLMILLPNDLFRTFSGHSGECFVVDDHDHTPWIFTRVKNFEWLKRDFGVRLPIALWIYQNSIVLQDRDRRFDEILQEQKRAFNKAILEILRRKYLEFRTERHNLRHALERKNAITVALIKATVVKLALEMSFLVEGKPYPYKKWLPLVVQSDTIDGKELFQISEDFLSVEDPLTTTELSDRLVEKVSAMLIKTQIFPVDFIQQWWLHLI